MRINSGPGTLEDRTYTGFMMMRLGGNDYSYTFNEEGAEQTFIRTYQKTFDNLIDHIYILKITESGEMVINYIGTRLKRESKFEDTYTVFKLKDKLIFFFYDDPANLNNKTNDLMVKTTNPSGKTTLLVSCTYSYLNDDLSSKYSISDRKTMKVCPYIEGSDIYYDESNSLYTVFYQGKTKKGKVKKLYMISFTD
ncbi:MAG: hypothetical protein IT245_03010 [Bacteroidia bacterium]|nr:hypothetical protein [Bacteroidia bacterium]